MYLKNASKKIDKMSLQIAGLSTNRLKIQKFVILNT